MDLNSSVNAFGSNEIKVGSDRRRLYSWSRPSKNLPRHERPGRHGSEMEICGMATLAFSKDLSWFQGNIVNDQSDTYTIRGSLLHEAANNDDDSLEKESEEKFCLCQADSLVIDSSSPNNSLISDDSILTPPSDNDSFDSELVRSSIQNLSLEDELVYRVTIGDYETGLTHTLQSVTCTISSDTCNMRSESEDMEFKSSSCSKGYKADKVILSRMGQDLTGNNMRVFQGTFRYTYDDMVCYPVDSNFSQSHGQWCL